MLKALKNLSTAQAMVLSVSIFALTVLLGSAIIANTSFVIRNLGGSANGLAPENTISVSATGESYLKPDTANFSVGVSERAGTTAEAISRANAKIAEIRKALKGKVDDKNIQTSSFSLNPEYDQRESGQVLVGQRASQTVTVKMTGIKSDAGDVAALIDEIGKINNVQFNSVYFSAENDDTALAQARADAMSKAAEKAGQLAKNAKVRIVAPLSIAETSSGLPAPLYYGRETAANDAGGKVTELNPGELKITISLAVVYAIE